MPGERAHNLGFAAPRLEAVAPDAGAVPADIRLWHGWPHSTEPEARRDGMAESSAGSERRSAWAATFVQYGSAPTPARHTGRVYADLVDLRREVSFSFADPGVSGSVP